MKMHNSGGIQADLENGDNKIDFYIILFMKLNIHSKSNSNFIIDLLNPKIANNDLQLKKDKLNVDEAISKTSKFNTKKMLIIFDYILRVCFQLEFGLFNYVLTFVSGLVILSMVTEKSSIAYIFSVSQCDLNLTSSAKGFLGSVNSLGMICTLHLWGYLADTLGRRCIIQYTLVAAFLTSVMSSLVQNTFLHFVHNAIF